MGYVVSRPVVLRHNLAESPVSLSLYLATSSWGSQLSNSHMTITFIQRSTQSMIQSVEVLLRGPCYF